MNFGTLFAVVYCMTNNEINRFRAQAVANLEAGRLSAVIEDVRALPADVRDYAINSSLDAVAEHYKYLLHYFAEGAADPGRRDSYDDLRTDLRCIVDRCMRKAMAQATPTLYYNTLRTLALHPERTLAAAVDEWREQSQQLASTFAIDNAASELRHSVDSLENEIFERVWTTFPMSASEQHAVATVLEDDEPEGHNIRMRITAAVGLGLMEFYDARRFDLLAAVADTAADEREAQAATTWILLALFRYRRRKHSREVRSRLRASADHPLWQRRVREIYLELLRARDTERVTKRVRDEMMPDIMRMGRDIIDSGAMTVDDTEGGIEVNPEWEEKMREAGVYDRMREFSEMTSEGADVFMGAFAHLKNFPFFSRLQAWFTPFDAGNSDVARGLEGDMAAFVDALTHVPLPCDNDKFSILFSLGATPANQRELLARQLEANREAMEQSLQGDGSAGFSRAYVQNLYRFYKLYGRRSEFFDPFARGIFLQDIELLQSAVRNADTLTASAQLLFSIDAWADARTCFELLGNIGEPSAEIYQKTAYCLEQMGQYAEAADNYAFADLMDGSNEWTLRRLAHTLEMADRPERAVGAYERLLERKPGDRYLTKRLAYTLIKTGDYARAAGLLRRLAASDPDAVNPDMLRALAWSTFVSGDTDAARGYYREILNVGPRGADYLNMGHLAWAEGRIADAIRLYGKYADGAGADVDGLERDIRADLPALAAYSLNLSDLPLILDSVRMARR